MIHEDPLMGDGLARIHEMEGPTLESATVQSRSGLIVRVYTHRGLRLLPSVSPLRRQPDQAEG